MSATETNPGPSGTQPAGSSHGAPGLLARGLVALVTASAAGFAAFAVFTYGVDDRPLVRWGVPVGVGVVLLPATGFLLARLTRRGRGLPRGYPRLALVPGLVVGSAAALLCPREFSIPRATPQALELVATPENNPAAQGNEVWVEALVGPDGRPVPVEALEFTGDWEIRDGIPISYQRKPATLRFRDELRGGVELRLATGEWSGIVELVWNGRRETIDLYAPEPGVHIVQLPRNPADAARFTSYFAAVRAALALLATVAAVLVDLVLCVRRSRPDAVDARPWTWPRLGGAMGVVALSLLLASYTGEFARDRYFRALIDPDVGAAQNLARARGVRDLLAAHVPPGKLIFSDRITSRWLPALYDCYILAPKIGANILIADPQRGVDLEFLLDPLTPWPARRILLDKYEIEWAFINRWRLEEFGWALEHATDRWDHGDYILVRVPATPTDVHPAIESVGGEGAPQ